ncbi:hypothetical protein SOVF_171680 [Spinacia oleracea]|nr:hypothetical protein SOVF_171680 [Spinacia oleracea]
MGFVIVISLPLLLLVLIIVLVAYLLRRNRARSVQTQYYGPPAPPIGSAALSMEGKSSQV